MKVLCLSPSVAIQHETRYCCKLRTHQMRHLLEQVFAKPGGGSDSNGEIENILEQFRKSPQHCAATRQDEPGTRLLFKSGRPDFIPNDVRNLFCSRLDDVAQNLLRDRSLLMRSHAG